MAEVDRDVANLTEAEEAMNNDNDDGNGETISGTQSPAPAEPPQRRRSSRKSKGSKAESDPLSLGHGEADFFAHPHMREIKVPIPFLCNGAVECNPVTSILAIVLLLSLSAWCMSSPEASYVDLVELKANVTEYFTWFMVGSTPLMIVFMAAIYYFYGHQKLGPPDSEPEFDAFSYFAMIFSAGVAVGLFFFGVSEPLYHLASNRFATAYHTEDEIKNFAILQTVFHWGISAWVGYVLVGVTAGIVAYRDGYPMTMRSCFYPVLGAHTWGVYGDIIDAFSIVVVISGVCTSLGLGAIQIVDGITRQTALELEEDSDEENNVRIITIWVVTCIATISVVSGLNLGIKILSQLAMFLGLLLWFLVLIFDDTAYLLNALVASVGYYFQYGLIEMNFETDAFAQLHEGAGRSIDGRGAYAAWMDDWTIFYWAWWTAWASFVGLFIARVSKGRTIREVIHFTLAGPLVYTFLWFAIFGGAGIRMHSRALELQALGESLGDAEMFRTEGLTAGETCFEFAAGPDNVTQDMLTSLEIAFQVGEQDIGPVCLDVGDVSWWQTMEQYYEFGSFLSWLSLAALAIYFVTSSDSGSLIVDHLASNGREDHFWLQRVFWAFMEGGVATALLVAGKSNALRALQAASIIAGLPFKALLLIMCTCLYRLCNNYSATDHRQFSMPVYGGVFGFLDVLAATVSFQMITERPTMYSVYEAGWALIAPWRAAYYVTGSKLTAVAIGFFHAATVLLAFVAIGVEGAGGFAVASYIVFVSGVSYVRYAFRTEREIYGNFAEDFFSSLFLFFQVLAQLVVEMDKDEPTQIEEDEEDVKVAERASADSQA